jgi:ABC-type lipoprotein release transport system permease subunit
MAFTKFLSIAFRDLLRNGRRTALTALAVALGLVVVMSFSGLLEGMVESMLADNIRLSTGHLQIREESYDADKGSLLARDLLSDPEAVTEQVEALPEVASAAPVLWLSGLIATPQESNGVQVVGIRPEDAFNAPIREGIVAGEYLNSEDRDRILMGQVLARQMDVSVGDRVGVAISDANGVGQDGVFEVAGLVDTGFPSIDHHRILLPLREAQTFSGVGDRFSSLIVMLNDQDDTAQVAARFSGADTQVVTWEDLNRIILESVDSGMFFYYILYGIVFLAVAVLIANTLLMSVFARAREIGILSSLGMTGGQIMELFMLEGFLLALLGIAAGWVLGLGAVYYLANVGFSIPAETSSMVEGMAFGTQLKGGYAPEQFIILSVLMLLFVTLVSLYPAWYAARMEPVEALHTQ